MARIYIPVMDCIYTIERADFLVKIWRLTTMPLWQLLVFSEHQWHFDNDNLNTRQKFWSLQSGKESYLPKLRSFSESKLLILIHQWRVQRRGLRRRGAISPLLKHCTRPLSKCLAPLKKFLNRLKMPLRQISMIFWWLQPLITNHSFCRAHTVYQENIIIFYGSQWC